MYMCVWIYIYIYIYVDIYIYIWIYIYTYMMVITNPPTVLRKLTAYALGQMIYGDGRMVITVHHMLRPMGYHEPIGIHETPRKSHQSGS